MILQDEHQHGDIRYKVASYGTVTFTVYTMGSIHWLRKGVGRITLCSHTIGDPAVTGICSDEQLSTLLCSGKCVTKEGFCGKGHMKDLAKREKQKNSKSRIKKTQEVCMHSSACVMRIA